MSDEEGWTPHVPVPVRKPTAGIHVWTLAKDGHQRSCQLRPYGDDGRWGTEVQVRQDGELLVGKHFDSGELALEWATAKRVAHEKAGWRADT